MLNKKVYLVFSCIAMVVLCQCNAEKKATEKSAIMHQEMVEYSGFETAENRIIKDAANWEKTQAEIFKNQYPQPKLDIDFSTSNVVVIAFGQKSHGGYMYTAQSYFISDDTLHFVLHTPKRNFNDPVTMALTYPLLWIEIPKTEAHFVEYTISNE